MRELDNQVIHYDDTQEKASLDVNLVGNIEAISFIHKVLQCLIDGCKKNWEKDK